MICLFGVGHDEQAFAFREQSCFNFMLLLFQLTDSFLCILKSGDDGYCQFILLKTEKILTDGCGCVNWHDLPRPGQNNR